MARVRTSGGLVVEQATDGRHGFARHAGRGADGGEESRPDLAIGVGQPGRQFPATPGARGRICPRARRRTATDASLRGLDGLRSASAARTADLGQGLGDRVDRGCPHARGRRAAEGPRPGPILPSRNAAWRATPSFLAVRSDSSSGARRGSNAGRPTSRSTTASRTRSSSSPRFSWAGSAAGRHRATGISPATSRPPPGPPGPRHVSRTRGPPRRTRSSGAGRCPGPRPPRRGSMTSLRPEAAISGSTAAGPIRPSASEASRGCARSCRRAGGPGRGRRLPRRARSAPGP